VVSGRGRVNTRTMHPGVACAICCLYFLGDVGSAEARRWLNVSVFTDKATGENGVQVDWILGCFRRKVTSGVVCRVCASTLYRWNRDGRLRDYSAVGSCMWAFFWHVCVLRIVAQLFVMVVGVSVSAISIQST